VLDAAGDPMGAYFIGAASVHHSRGSDLELAGTLASQPHPRAREIWNHWHQAKPSTLNEWVSLPPAGRAAWLEVTRLHHRWSRHPDAPQGTVISLDAAQVRDPVDFYCAIGEAVNGPGGYFGANLDSLHDCLRGGFGITAPFDLIWQPPPPTQLKPQADILQAAGVHIR
jgi:RNAse (barnase) inhibitor barstar